MNIAGFEPFNLLCSGGIGRIEEQPEGNLSDLPKKEDVVAPVLDDRESRVQAARERFLARKGKK